MRPPAGALVVNTEAQELDRSVEEYSTVSAWPAGATTSKPNVFPVQAALVRTRVTDEEPLEVVTVKYVTEAT